MVPCAVTATALDQERRQIARARSSQKVGDYCHRCGDKRFLEFCVKSFRTRLQPYPTHAQKRLRA